MKKFSIVLVAFGLLIIGIALSLSAQSVVQMTFGVSPTFLLANCSQIASYTTFCPTGDGKIYVMVNGQTAWTCIANCGAVVAGVQKVNGIAPDATGNVTVPIPKTAILPSSVPLQ